MYSPLSAIVRRPPATVPLEATVRATLELMDRLHIDSIVVAGETGVPLGIFTLHDLLRRVTLVGGELSQPVAGVMTSGLITLPPTATAHHAALTMARNRVGQVVVVDNEGRLAGVVSQGELFTLHQLGAEALSDVIQAATGLEGLRDAADGVRRLTASMLMQGVAAEPLSHVISTLNDLLTARLVEITGDEHELPPVPMCWMALGSEGRLEQTFITDQDNAIIFEAARSDADAVRAALLPFARAVNERLDACGFSLCKGDVMAGNPRWCLSSAEWHRVYSRWIEEPVPEALLNAAIFFDLRPVYGSERLAERLRDSILASARGGRLFLRHMADNALQGRPALGWLRQFAVTRSSEFPHTIDLKAGGSRIFVDAARVLALGQGIAHTSTAERLRALAEPLGIGPGEVRELVDAFFFVHTLRLRQQAEPGRPAGWANRTDPRQLHRVDRHLLRRALGQAASLQRRVAADYCF